MARDQQEIDMSPFENCIQDPQAILSRALENKNIRDFKIALEMDADPTRIDENTNISIFEKALQTYRCAEFVEQCIRRGCKCDYTNRRLNKTPINFAADSKDPKILLCILKLCSKEIPINAKYSNLTALNSLAKSINSDNYDDVFECIKILLNFGANPNIPDQKEMTPILYIINNRKLDSNKKKEIIKYFLDNCNNLDLDTYRDGEARERLKSKYPDEFILPEDQSYLTTDNITFDMLLSFLHNCNEEKFIKFYNEYHLNLSLGKDNQENSIQENTINLLQESIKKYLINATDTIIKSDKINNINLLIKGCSSIELACIYGNWKALQLLLDHVDLKLRKYENLLITIIKKLDEEQNNLSSTLSPYMDYYKCFYILLNSSPDKINVNEIDKSGTSALHYAVKYKNEKAIKELLKHGAYIGVKSQYFNDIAITDINSDFLEDYFDSCITTNGLKPGDDNFEIIINYKNLIPPSSLSSSSGFSTSPMRTASTAAGDDTGIMIKSSINPSIYKVNEEMLPIEHIANAKELRHLLKHPLITSFLYLKWHRLSIMFYINFILYSLFCGSLVTYIILNFNNTSNEFLLYTFKLFSFIGLCYMIIRELIQLFISPLMFIKSKINYMEIALILLTIITLFEPNYEKEKQRILAVCTILLASIELCLLVGSLPVLSISTHMLMLQAVSRSFIKSFTLYSIFVITFSLCFYILFGRTHNTNQNSTTEKSNNISNDDNTKTADDEGEFNKFSNPFTAIIKTIVMLTGEFDAGDIDFNSLTSYLVFLLFVFFMSIVLFNLLNGLAVSDTQAIKSQAELNGSICRTNLLSSYEKVLTGHNTKTGGFFINYQPFRTICKRLTNLFPNFICGEEIAILPNDYNKILIPIKIQNLNNDEFHDQINDEIQLRKNFNSNGKFSLNQNNDNNNDGNDNNGNNKMKILNAPVKLLPCCCSCLTGKCSQMDMRTVKTALQIIEKNHLKLKEKHKLQNNENRLKKIEEKIDKIFNLLQDINLK